MNDLRNCIIRVVFALFLHSL